MICKLMILVTFAASWGIAQGPGGFHPVDDNDPTGGEEFASNATLPALLNASTNYAITFPEGSVDFIIENKAAHPSIFVIVALLADNSYDRYFVRLNPGEQYLHMPISEHSNAEFHILSMQNFSFRVTTVVPSMGLTPQREVYAKPPLRAWPVVLVNAANGSEVSIGIVKNEAHYPLFGLCVGQFNEATQTILQEDGSVVPVK